MLRKIQTRQQKTANEVISQLSASHEARDYKDLALNYKRLLRDVFYDHMELQMKVKAVAKHSPHLKDDLFLPLEQIAPEKVPDKITLKKKLKQFALTQGWSRYLLERLDNPL